MKEEESDSESVDLCAQEYIFVMDRSGSMYFGEKAILMAKEALKVFLHSLPEGSLFNVCSFGSDYSLIFEQSVLYNQEHLEMALSVIEGQFGYHM